MIGAGDRVIYCPKLAVIEKRRASRLEGCFPRVKPEMGWRLGQFSITDMLRIISESVALITAQRMGL